MQDALKAEIEALRRYIEALEDAILSGDDAASLIRMRRMNQPTRPPARAT